MHLETRPLHDAASIRACDAAAIASGIPGVALMAAAGEGAAGIVLAQFPSAARVVCLCGGGNNGGDGLVVAASLRRAGLDARCVVVSDRAYEGDAAWAEQQAIAAGVPIERGGGETARQALAEADLVVDGLLGTGFSGVPRGAIAEAIEALSGTALPVVALDIPSGVDASTGAAPGPSVCADLTVSFHAEKIGLRVVPGLERAGGVQVVEIGIPRSLSAAAPARIVAGARPEPRGRGGSKYDNGMVVVIGGSTGMTGAVALAALAALRAGAGIVTACVPASLNTILEVKLTEPMTRPVADEAGAMLPQAADAIVAACARADAVVLGNGLGRDSRTVELVRMLVGALDLPLVLDADALYAIGSDLDLLRSRVAPTLVTPHGGEAARLLGTGAAAVAAGRLAAARAIAAGAGATCLLKGPDTLIVGPDGALDVRDGDDPALATAGVGDVLAGACGALLARGASVRDAAAAAACAQLAAAASARVAQPGRGIIAGDLIDHLALA